MGYHTNFEGGFAITPNLKPEHQSYLRKFNETRRMQRDASKTVLRPDPIREAAGLPVGVEGEFFVGESGFMGQGEPKCGKWSPDISKMPDIVQYNHPPSTQHGLWCGWNVDDDGSALGWDGGEKFSSFIDWLSYIIDNFMQRWGYRLDGIVRWQGEERSDAGFIIIRGNKVRVIRGPATPLELIAIHAAGMPIPAEPTNGYCYDA